MSVPPLPTPISLATLDGVKKDADVYAAFKNVQVRINAMINYLSQTSLQGATSPQGPITPKGVQNVSAAQLDGTIQITWNDEVSGAVPITYQVWGAAAGTRSAPTTPTWGSATRFQKVPAQTNTYYPIGSVHQFIDKNFTVTQKDPSNPSRITYWITTLDQFGNESIPIQAANTPIEIPLNGPGDNPAGVVEVALNKIYNAAFVSTDVTTANVNVTGSGPQDTIQTASNASPIAVTTTAPHALVTGNTTFINGVVGNTAANGFWVVTKTGAATFTLNNSTGNGAYVSGGNTWYAFNQPTPPLSSQNPYTFEYPWTPWGEAGQSIPTGNVQYVSDGTAATGEVILKGGAAFYQHAIIQFDMPFYFRAGQHLVLSIYAKRSGVAGGENLSVFYTDPGNVQVSHTFSGSLLTSVYQRFAFAFALPNPLSGFSFKPAIEFMNGASSGTGADILITKPMLNVGNIATAWTATSDSFLSPGSLVSSDPTVDTLSRTTQQVIFRDASSPYV